MKNKIWTQTVTDKIELTVDDVTDIIGTTTANQQCETIMEENVTIEKDSTSLATTSLFDSRRHRFKAKASTQQTIPLMKTI